MSSSTSSGRSKGCSIQPGSGMERRLSAASGEASAPRRLFPTSVHRAPLSLTAMSAIALLLLLFFSFVASMPAVAAFPPAVDPAPAASAKSSCVVCGWQVDDSELLELEQRILEADSLERARQLATRDSRMAQDVLRRARWMAPGSESLGRASRQLTAFHSEVDRASSRPAIVGSLRSLVASGPDVDSGCDYTTGEIVAIVLGFILGIIPGLILLVLLC